MDSRHRCCFRYLTWPWIIVIMSLQQCLSWNPSRRLSPWDHCVIFETGMRWRMKVRRIFCLVFCRWNQLDTTIVVLSVAGIVMEKMKSGQVLPINPTLIRVMRVMRIARGKIFPIKTNAYSMSFCSFSSQIIKNGKRYSSIIGHGHSSFTTSGKSGKLKSPRLLNIY